MPKACLHSLTKLKYLAVHYKLYRCCCVQEARALLKSLEQLAEEEQCTPVPRHAEDRDDEQEDPEQRKSKLRRKRSKRTTQKNPAPTGGASSSHGLWKLVIKDTGADAQPQFVPETPTMSTQKKDIPETQKESSPEPKRPRTSSPGPPNTQVPSSPSPKSGRRKRKAFYSQAFQPEGSRHSEACQPEGSRHSEAFQQEACRHSGAFQPQASRHSEVFQPQAVTKACHAQAVSEAFHTQVHPEA